MRINIDFSQAVKYTFDSKWFNKVSLFRINGDSRLIQYDVMAEIGNELKDVLIEDYFNGADLAVKYMGFSIDNEEFEFELMSN